MKRGGGFARARNFQPRQYPRKNQRPYVVHRSAPSPSGQGATTAPNMDQVYGPALATAYAGTPSGAGTTSKRAAPPTPSSGPDTYPSPPPPAKYHRDERHRGWGGGNSSLFDPSLVSGYLHPHQIRNEHDLPSEVRTHSHISVGGEATTCGLP